MVIVKSCLPQRTACKVVDGRPGASIVEFRCTEIQIAAQHPSIHLLLLLRQNPAGKGPRDIRGSLQILSAGIHQQEASGLERNVCLRCRLIVHDGTMGTKARDGIEADSEEMLLFLPELQQSVAGGQLRDRMGRIVVCHLLLEPVHKLRDRHAILQMCLPGVLHFHRGADRLRKQGWIRRIDHADALRHGGPDRIVDGRCVKQ